MTTSTGSPTGSCWLTISIFPPGRTVVLMCSARCMTCDLLFTGYRRRTNKTAHASKAVRPRHPSIRAPWPPRYPHSNPLPWEGEGIFVVAAESQGRHPNCPNNQHPPSFTSFRIIHIIVQNAADPTRRTSRTKTTELPCRAAAPSAPCQPPATRHRCPAVPPLSVPASATDQELLDYLPPPKRGR